MALGQQRICPVGYAQRYILFSLVPTIICCLSLTSFQVCVSLLVIVQLITSSCMTGRLLIRSLYAQILICGKPSNSYSQYYTINSHSQIIFIRFQKYILTTYLKLIVVHIIKSSYHLVTLTYIYYNEYLGIHHLKGYILVFKQKFKEYLK